MSPHDRKAILDSIDGKTGAGKNTRIAYDKFVDLVFGVGEAAAYAARGASAKEQQGKRTRGSGRTSGGMSAGGGLSGGAGPGGLLSLPNEADMEGDGAPATYTLQRLRGAL